jgi:uncharacterized protein (TIGR03084 family)
METWAHGVDISDSLGLAPAHSDRLKHVAFLGWRAFANSFRANGLAVPDVPVRVECEEWTFGPAEARNIVHGSALDFCLVVTQRRHLDDTDLSMAGPVASEWMKIAQAFAGPPGAGRQPGQHGEPRE